MINDFVIHYQFKIFNRFFNKFFIYSRTCNNKMNAFNYILVCVVVSKINDYFIFCNCCIKKPIVAKNKFG